MPEAISNTSPLLYLHRIGFLDCLPRLFSRLWIPTAVARELQEGAQRGYDVPNPDDHKWMSVADPVHLPSEWLALDLGAGELAAMALALENPDRILFLDDALARRTAKAAGLQVQGTLKVLLNAKQEGLIEKVEPFLARLGEAGLWVSDDVRRRVLALAGEHET
ncbi:MAG: DUF3368 domain-containing protein [Planctomycetota bacterium]